MKIERGLRSVIAAINAKRSTEGSSAYVDLLHLLGDMMAFYSKYWSLPVDWAYEELVSMLPNPADHLLAAAIDADQRKLGAAAVRFAETAAALSKERKFEVSAAIFLRKHGFLQRARQLAACVTAADPYYLIAQSQLFECDVAERFWQKDYYELFAEIHRYRQPRVYVEIGVATGKSLALTRTGTTALGIDPASAEPHSLLYHSPQNDPKLYKMTSDDFFATKDVTQEMGASHFDVAFIDGLHHFDQVLRDFINLERFAGPNSTILIHDCLPINRVVATRERSTAFWTGDVWKVIPCLAAVRPDLEIITLPFAPSGVAIIRRLDPTSKILGRQYHSLVQHFDTLEMPDDWEACCRMLNVVMDQSAFDVAEHLKRGTSS